MIISVFPSFLFFLQNLSGVWVSDLEPRDQSIMLESAPREALGLHSPRVQRLLGRQLQARVAGTEARLLPTNLCPEWWLGTVFPKIQAVCLCSHTSGVLRVMLSLWRNLCPLFRVRTLCPSLTMSSSLM